MHEHPSMGVFSIFTCASTLVFLIHLAKLFVTSIKNRRGKKFPPSPPSLPIIGHLHLLKKPLHQTLSRLSAQHGPIFSLRFGTRNALIISSASLAEECFTTNDIVFANRPKLPSARFLSYNYTNIGNADYGLKWREMRRVAAAEALSGPRQAFFAGVRAEEARSMTRQLVRDTAMAEFARVELRMRLFGLAINVMMRVLVGKRLYGENEGGGEARRFKEMVEMVFSRAGVSNFADFLPAGIGWFERRSVRKAMRRIYDYMDGLFQDLVEEGRRKVMAGEGEEGISTNTTVLGSILAGQKNQTEQYSDTFIKALFVSFLFAGTDTLSKMMEWVMALLLNNPEKLEIARQEIDERVGHERLMEESDLSNLPYLHCIINETFRLYPINPLLLPHYSLEPCKVGGYDVLPHTMLIVNAHVIHRDPETWQNPTEFMPERFLDDDGDEGAKMLPFGMGRRRCPGEGFAMREIGLVLGVLIQCFEWRRVGSQEVDLKEGSGIIMPKAIPLEALCKPRQIMLTALSQL